MKLTKKQIELCDKIYKETDIEIENQLETTDAENFDELVDELQDNGMFDIEIIYYHNAMEYLMEHDSSLRESLDLASEMGFKIEDITSEKLASLLASQNARVDFQEFEDEINEVIFKI